MKLSSCPQWRPKQALLCVIVLLLLTVNSVLANVPGGGTGTGANVTLTDNGSTVTLGNGIVSILCTKSGASINQINYTYNNGGGIQTLNLLSGGNNGGQLYWENSSSQGLTFTYSLVVDPASNGGNYAEISMVTTSVTNDVLEVHFSLLRGATGFYVTAIYGHRSIDGAFGMGECRDNIYAGSIFNWMSVDATRNRLMEVSGGAAIGVQGAPVEVSLWTNGIYAGQYEDKYKYGADLGLNHVWGWSSVGAGGKNVGLWNITASSEYYNGGPLKRELMEHIGTTILNMLNGGHYGMGADGNWATGEVWTKVDGPYFIYCNTITNTITGTNQAAQALYSDALAQGVAEAGAWPYAWFTNANYAPAANRGAVTGKIVINDSGNPNASAAGLWVGLIRQPVTITATYDFQQWMKPYQFWTKTDTNGNFILTNIIAGANYTLYAYGPGAPAMFMSQNQTGGNPPVLFDLPTTPFAVAVTGGGNTNLGSVTWKPGRVGATVFEIGYPNRTSDKFRHGDDWWVGEIGPKPTAPSPIWSKWLEFPLEFPNGLNYVVGQSRWSTEWNFVQPIVVSSAGVDNNSSSTITFNLATAPTNGAQASLYLGLSSDYYSAIIVTVNGNNLGSVSGVTGTPATSIPTTGYSAGYSASDTTIREGNQAAASDERLTFPASQLHAGANTINIGIRQAGGSYFADHAMYDYLRLELTGYVPPPPASVAAYAGNNGNLVSWPVVPGATSYNVLRSTNAVGTYVSITNGVTGPVCGSGAVNAVWLDATAGNGTNYFYEVSAVNPTGTSTNSPPSSGVTPSAGIATSVPAAPAGVSVGGVAHQSVSLNWSASTGANLYAIYRSTLVNSGGGSSNVLSTILLNNAITNLSYTDASPTDGSLYRYCVTATSAGGTSTNSAFAVAMPLPAPATALPPSLTASFVYTTSTNITLNWTAVPGAIGYVISRSTSLGGTYTYLQTVTETTYTDYGLNASVVYYYHVAAMNAAGVSGNNTDLVNSKQTFPTNLTATATNAQIMLSWSAVSNATSYTLKRGTSVGAETVTVVTGYTGTNYTNSGLVNGVTYYYVVTATGSGGASGNSPEVSATPLTIGNGIWQAPVSGNWSATTNWTDSSIASGTGSSADFSTLGLSSNLTVTLDSARTLSRLVFGDTAATYNWTLTGTNALTLGISPYIDVENQSATLSVPLAGTNGLTKAGPGALSLGGATYSFTGGTTVSVGMLALDFSAASSPVTNLIPAANSLTLGGGTLQIIGSSNIVNTQAFAGTVLNAGGSVMAAAPDAGNNYPTLNLAGITESVGGVVEFMGPATVKAGGASVASNAVITATASGNNAFVNNSANYATVGLYDFAATIGASSPYTVIGGSQISGFYTAASGGSPSASGNLDVTGNITGWATQPYLASLRCNASLSANQTIALANKATTLTLSSILVTPNVGAYNVTFTSGNLRPGTGANVPLIVWQNNPAGQLILLAGIGNSSSGTTAYVQSGPGTVSLTVTSSGYTGQSYLNGGVSLIAGNGSLGPPATAAPVNLNGGTVVGNATFALDNAGTSLRPINVAGNGGGLAATSGNTLTVDGVVGSGADAGALVIGVAASSANNNTPGLLPGTGAGTPNAGVYATGTVVLTNANYYTGGTILQSGTLNFNGLYALGGGNFGGLTFNGGTLQYAANVLGNNGSADLTSIGTAGITLAAGGGTIDLNGNAVTYAGSIGNNGSGALMVKSSLPGGSLNLQSGNAYTGNTTLTNATLLANNATGSATGSGNLLVQNAGTLSGNGGIDGSVTVAAGGILTPGNPLGTLTLNNNLTMAAGSTTCFQVQHAPLTNDTIQVGGLLTEGGTLVVSNSGVAAFTSGDSFQLFNASGFSGAFTTVTLPALNAGLFWSKSQLAVGGTIGVVSTNPPAIQNVAVAGGNLMLQGTGGTPNWYYTVLSATNLTLPLAQWTAIDTNQFDASGNFNYTNAAAVAGPQQFYYLKVE